MRRSYFENAGPPHATGVCSSSRVAPHVDINRLSSLPPCRAEPFQLTTYVSTPRQEPPPITKKKSKNQTHHKSAHQRITASRPSGGSMVSHRAVQRRKLSAGPARTSVTSLALLLHPSYRAVCDIPSFQHDLKKISFCVFLRICFPCRHLPTFLRPAEHARAPPTNHLPW